MKTLLMNFCSFERFVNASRLGDMSFKVFFSGIHTVLSLCTCYCCWSVVRSIAHCNVYMYMYIRMYITNSKKTWKCAKNIIAWELVVVIAIISWYKHTSCTRIYYIHIVYDIKRENTHLLFLSLSILNNAPFKLCSERTFRVAGYWKLNTYIGDLREFC